MAVHGLRIIFPNTVFFSAHYRNACGSASAPDPGPATLAWLDAEFAAAKQAQERVWLVYHIPPGVDGYETLRQGACPGTIEPMWNQAYAEPFNALLQRYADTIAASFAGHTHMDDFRLLGDDSGYFAFVLITPAVSPIFGQNPAFRTVVYDPAGAILDQTTYDLTNLREAAAGGGTRVASGIHVHPVLTSAAGRFGQPDTTLCYERRRAGRPRPLAHPLPGVEPGILVPEPGWRRAGGAGGPRVSLRHRTHSLAGLRAMLLRRREIERQTGECGLRGKHELRNRPAGASCPCT